MELYWYWPFARQEEIALARHVVGPDDRLDVHVLDRPGAPSSEAGTRLRVIRNLPEVDHGRRRGPGWGVDRARTYLERHRRREEVLRQAHYDLVHLLFINRFTDAAVLRRRRNCVMVISVHDVLPHRSRSQSLERQLLSYEYRRTDHIVVHHEWVRDRLHQLFPRTAPVHVVPLQVPPPRPSSTVEDQEPFVLCFGTLRENKGIDVLLQAMERTRGDWRLVIAGRGDGAIEARVRQAAARDGRILAEIGWVTPERKSELYRQASMVVLPYTGFESQSAVLHDAYGHGVPVIATDVGALGPSVREDRTGWVVDTRDADMLARALDLAMGEPDLRGDFATNALAIARQRHPSEIGRALRELYGTLLSPGAS